MDLGVLGFRPGELHRAGLLPVSGGSEISDRTNRLGLDRG